MIYEVDLDVVPLDVYGIVLGSPYLYDRTTIFFRKEKKYHLTKDGVEYIIRAHNIKEKSTLVSSFQVKRVINTNKNLVLTIVKGECHDKSVVVNALDPLHKNGLLEMRQVFQWEGSQWNTFDTLKINMVPMLALPDLQQPCKFETSASTNVIRTNLFFRYRTIRSIVLKNVSLDHINNDGWYTKDEIFKDVCVIF
jgi:hypothetical protein